MRIPVESSMDGMARIFLVSWLEGKKTVYDLHDNWYLYSGILRIIESVKGVEVREEDKGDMERLLELEQHIRSYYRCVETRGIETADN